LAALVLAPRVGLVQNLRLGLDELAVSGPVAVRRQTAPRG
jgi:hypothetical protein